MAPRANEFRQGITIVVTLTEEDAVWTKARPHEPCVFDQDAVKAYNFIKGELAPASLHHGPPPPLKSVAWRALAFDLKTRPAIGEQQEAGGAGDEMAAGVTDDVACLFGECEIDKSASALRAANNRTEAGRAEGVVPDAVTR